jgi:hypothetical protein
MALDQSAPLDLLNTLKAADVGDRVRQAAETIYQAQIEAELTAVIGAAPTNAPPTAPPNGTATALQCRQLRGSPGGLAAATSRAATSPN